MQDAFALGIGIGTRAGDGRWLEVFYAEPLLRPDGALVRAIVDASDGAVAAGANSATELTAEQWRNVAARLEGWPAQARLAGQVAAVAGRAVLTLLASDAPLASAPETYLKLHLLSHRLVLPNSMNLEGIFATLPNVAWTSEGAVAADELAARQLDARIAGRTLTVHAVDKFPRMADYVVPAGVRIADASRLRLGAYAGNGTTVMHEGFINFNAGAIGPNMIEGRISQGVIVGAHSDLGGSASTMGTLSGGGNIVISLGEKCLVGANAGTGIPLGDRCTIEAGLYITAGTVVEVVDEDGTVVRTVKARELASGSDLKFIRNSRTGRVECRTNRKAIELNDALHAHN
jgi:2,3,4,5-tetrahydropyridine-2-carboxylate N-succinyltransferase